MARLTSVPLATLIAASSRAPSLNRPQAINQAQLASGGKPELLYIGAEFCPACAAERWALLVALSHFGTFTNVSQTRSAAADGNVATLSFHGAPFTSPELTLTAVETTTNQPSGNYYKGLDAPTGPQLKTFP